LSFVSPVVVPTFFTFLVFVNWVFPFSLWCFLSFFSLLCPISCRFCCVNFLGCPRPPGLCVLFQLVLNICAQFFIPCALPTFFSVPIVGFPSLHCPVQYFHPQFFSEISVWLPFSLLVFFSPFPWSHLSLSPTVQEYFPLFL